MSETDQNEKPRPSWSQVNRAMGLWSAHHRGEWAGIPMPIEYQNLILEDKNPWIDEVMELQKQIHRESGKPPRDKISCTPEDLQWNVVNEWWSNRERRKVTIIRNSRTMETRIGFNRYDHAQKATMLLDTLGAAHIWPLEAEIKALEKLADLMPKPHLYQMYITTGMFMETSPKSKLTYIFRRLRPTLAMSFNGEFSDEYGGRIIAAMCMHPIGYYGNTHAGVLVPTDDVIAHLLMMRGDEHMFWRRCNQHSPERPEAGL